MSIITKVNSRKRKYLVLAVAGAATAIGLVPLIPPLSHDNTARCADEGEHLTSMLEAYGANTNLPWPRPPYDARILRVTLNALKPGYAIRAAKPGPISNEYVSTCYPLSMRPYDGDCENAEVHKKGGYEYGVHTVPGDIGLEPYRMHMGVGSLATIQPDRTDLVVIVPDQDKRGWIGKTHRNGIIVDVCKAEERNKYFDIVRKMPRPAMTKTPETP